MADLSNRTVVTNNTGRVFIQSANNMLGCCPEYLGWFGIGGVSQGRSDNITIKGLSDTTQGGYDVIDRITGQLSEITFDLKSYLGLHGESLLRKLFVDNCAATIHIHYGGCNPMDFRDFEKAIVIDNVVFNSYDTSDLIVLDSSNVAVIEETVSAEALTMYEYFAEKKFDLVSSLVGVDPVNVHLLGGSCSNVCVFCSDCSVSSCAQNFYTIPQDTSYVDSFSNTQQIYTVELDGDIKKWDYYLITDGVLSCATIGTISLNTNETILSASYDIINNIIVVGTSDGRVIFYQINNGSQQVELSVTAQSIINIVSNKYGYLVATNGGSVYYSKSGSIWSNPTTTSAGTIEAMLLYSKDSWILSMSSGSLYYTNNSGEDYFAKQYPKEQGNIIKQFAQSNHSILHAINDTYLYQSFDAGCNWQAIDLGKYFSSLFNVVVCASNPFVVYVSGVSVDASETYIVKINFGV